MQQESALHILQLGHSVFLTGAAGTGKTYVLNSFINYLRDHSIFPTIVAPTGIAASHLGGMTIHSCFGLGPFDHEPNDSYLEKALSRTGVKRRLKNMDVLIVDEVSMLSPVLFSVMDRMLRMAKGVDIPFGDIQLVLTGDFFQLPPVMRGQERSYIWQTTLWDEVDLYICYLKKSFRQKDSALLTLLEEIRTGTVSEDSMNHLRRRYKKNPEGKSTITKLYTHNIDIDRINRQELQKLEEPLEVFVAETYGPKKKIEKLIQNSLLQEELHLKTGATVMFIKNSPEQRFINGTIGVVVGFSDKRNPLVETSTGVLEVEKMEWKEEDDQGKVIATVWQMPLRLAWAITIHKSQGMTLDAAEIDLSKTFEVGQGYVALSRLKQFDDLKLMGFNRMAIQTAPELLEEDMRMQTLSEAYEEEVSDFSEDTLKVKKSQYIADLGGYAIDIEGEQRPAPSIKDTYDFTKQLVEEQYTVDAIAKRRGLTKSTVFRHLEEIRALYPEVSMEYLKPLPPVMKDIEVVVMEIQKRASADDFAAGGKIRKRSVYEALGGSVDYDDIALALLFL